jgi:hypothetical protein
MGAGGKFFNDVVAARTRAAQQILDTPDLRARFESLGGLKADLEKLIQTGLAAEALNHAQSDAKATGKAATIQVLQAFEALQDEYSLILGAARAVRSDLAAEQEPGGVIQRLDDIIRNEAQVTVTIEEAVDGGKSRKVRRKASQEALRAEIEKDAVALAGFTEIAGRLTERRCDPQRLERLRRSAQELSGQLGNRVVKKGAQKAITSQEQEMVAAQRQKWGGVYRLLAALGRQDERVMQLLREAGRS